MIWCIRKLERAQKKTKTKTIHKKNPKLSKKSILIKQKETIFIITVM